MKKKTPVRRAPPALTVVHHARQIEWVAAFEPLKLPPGHDHLGAVTAVGWVCDGLVLDMELTPARAAVTALEASLRRALKGGRAPRPDLARIARPDGVPAIRRVLGPAVTITVAATPEVAALVADLSRYLLDTNGSLASRMLSLLALGDLHPAAVARFFAAAAAVYRRSPWSVFLTDDDVVMLDAPALGLRRACLSVMGQMRETFGVQWLADANAYALFRAAIAASGAAAEPPGVTVRGVLFEGLEALDAAVRQELIKRRWALAGPAALPVPFLLREDGAPGALSLEDLLEATIVLEALDRLVAEHAAAIPARAPCAGRYALSSPEGTIHAEVVFPHPDDTGPDTPRARAAKGSTRPSPPDAPTGSPVTLGAGFERRFPGEAEAARREVAFASLGRHASERERSKLPAFQTSLVGLWTALWRPMHDGSTGLSRIEVTRSSEFAAARLLYGEVVDLRGAALVVTDLADGARYDLVDVPPGGLEMASRWLRVFAVVAPRGDGRWDVPSVCLLTAEGRDLTHAALVARVNDVLAALGRAPGVDPAAPRAGLLAHAGVAFAVFLRHADAERAKPAPKRFVTNTDGDPVEFVEAEVKLPVTGRRLAEAMARDGEFVQTAKETWDLLDPTSKIASPLGESRASIGREGRRWVVRGNSHQRVDAALDRVAALLGERPAVRSRKVTFPWDSDPTFARTREETTETMVMANGPAPIDMNPESLADIQRDRLFANLDRVVPMVGGVPRVVAQTEEGRALVEQWLRGAETMGRPMGDGKGRRWLDLDPMRVELGMPTVGR